ncbi:MAG: ribonuclease Z [Hadesarchaea archaeon]|nr:ribonuclease Z [Hadesarchaea archaeon]
MKLTFLGTSGSIPTPQRGLPAIALKRDRELLLFDCAEGTQRQMALAGLSPMRIRAIFITHLHGDHFLGLAGLVQTLSLMDRKERLDVYCPAGMKGRIESYLGIPYFTLTFEVKVHEFKPGDELRHEDHRIKTCEVDHPVPALAYALIEDPRPGEFYPEKAIELGVKPGPDFSHLKAGQSVKLRDGRVVKPEQVMGSSRPGRKVVYAGDTRPCESIVELARDADVLIHDCTLADELADKAAETAHSTPSEAAEIAKQANVKQLVLIHVSPRYEDDSILLKQAKQVFQNVVVAKDLMEIEVKLQG